MAEEQFSLPKQVPVFPLPNVVLFPHLDLPLFIFEPRYQQMLKDVTEKDHIFSIALIKEDIDLKEEPLPMHDIVGVGMVKFSTDNDDGTSQIIIGGLSRARLGKQIQSTPYLIYEIEPLEDIVEEGNEELALTERIKELFIRKEQMTKIVTTEHIENIYQMDDPSRLSDIITFFSTVSFSRKQEVMETLNVNDRLRLVIKLLEGEISRLESKN